MNNNQVTEKDLRMPQFRDARLEDLEFDSSGEVVRKDRFETSMRKISGKLHGVNGLSARSGWTCEQVVEAVSMELQKLKRLEQLILVVESAPEDAEFYHFENECYVKNIDKEQLEIAKSDSSGRHLINFEFAEIGEDWETNSAWIEYIKSLMSIKEIKERIPRVLHDDGEDE